MYDIDQRAKVKVAQKLMISEQAIKLDAQHSLSYWLYRKNYLKNSLLRYMTLRPNWVHCPKAIFFLVGL